jgi:hypothetical protein
MGGPVSLGANTWMTATTIPAAAGVGGNVTNGSGGNAGLVIITYNSPTGVCSL